MGAREDLLDAAKRCLVDRGWGATTVRDVAAAAGTSHASIGYHFGSRDALMTEALIDAVGELGRELAATDERSGSTGRAEQLVETAGTHRELWLAQLEAVRHAQHSPEIRRILRSGQRQAQDGLGGPALQALVVGLVVQALVDPSRAIGVDAALKELRAVPAGPARARRNGGRRAGR
ncbi:TetR/AcrR family transcriptional regulator [Jatrophihabitans endophyticus]|uniref:TetR/AcrR family transcriptional regulator n=1 Tax=Jatrophihabitans endophyticus TaxID=1206085 RepID=UPI0019D8470F|nr:TetR/AcrR family transcriptional regulator [Jatrophihabitans endophyticus]MBE7188200.1 TetR/AcrR family transcriptional regulator [Jatrophihabitans endophyticus]